MSHSQLGSPTMNPTKTPTSNLQDATLRRRSSLRSFGTFTSPSLSPEEVTNPSAPKDLSVTTQRGSKEQSSNLRYPLPDSAISESQETPRGTKRNLTSPTTTPDDNPWKRRDAIRTPLPPSKPTASSQSPTSEAPRRQSSGRKSSTENQPTTSRRSSLRKSTREKSPEALRRHSTLRSYHLPPGLNLPKGVVLPIPGQPHRPRPKPTPKHICLRGKPPCGQEFPSRNKLHQHQRVVHGGAPLAWLQEETARKDRPECHVCGKICSTARLLEEHLRKAHKVGVKPAVVDLEDEELEDGD